MSATKVTLRKRELSRREYLGIYLHKRLKDAIERKSNNEKLQFAKAIRSERDIAILKQQFGFADHTRG